MSLRTATLRDDCLTLFKNGIAAADPGDGVRRSLCVSGDSVRLVLDLNQADRVRIGRWQRIHIIAVGKAAHAMALAANDVIPGSLRGSRPIVVTHDDQHPNPDFDTYIAGHPLPDAAGLNAVRHVIDRVSQASAGDLVLVLLSGGGSALLPCPVDGISLADKIQVTERLLASGASIDAINCVRKHLSKTKGGGLARYAYPADVHTLILSDVMSDDPSAIASGPTVADDTTFADAIAVLQTYGCWTNMPQTVRTHLSQGTVGLQPETVKSDDPVFAHCSHTLIGGNRLSVDTLLKDAASLGYDTSLYAQPLCGEARIVAETWADDIRRQASANRSIDRASIAGGETTVTLSRPHGIGGRNQELALAFALAAERSQLTTDWCFLSGGTDGRDGPTDAAGAVVDRGTLQRLRQAGIDPLAALDHHDAYPALRAAGDLLHTGATGTNVADLQILLMRSAPIPN